MDIDEQKRITAPKSMPSKNAVQKPVALKINLKPLNVILVL
jgi:hypothetical protein